MASSGRPSFTAGEVCEMVTDDNGDFEYICEGSDDDLGLEEECDDFCDLQEEHEEQIAMEVEEPCTSASLQPLDIIEPTLIPTLGSPGP